MKRYMEAWKRTLDWKRALKSMRSPKLDDASRLALVVVSHTFIATFGAIYLFIVVPVPLNIPTGLLWFFSWIRTIFEYGEQLNC